MAMSLRRCSSRSSSRDLQRCYQQSISTSVDVDIEKRFIDETIGT